MPARLALQSLNLRKADVQADIGPFLGVFLQQRGWQTGPIGTVMTVGGVAGMPFTAPAGAFIVNAGHTRSNAPVNDGRAISGAARAIGQIEERGGDAGVSLDDIPRDGVPIAQGGDIYAIDAWPEHGIEGTRLGPNKSGMHQ